MPTGLKQDVLKLSPGPLVTLYDLDLALVSGPILSWNPHTYGNMTFDGTVYVPADAIATGFERTTSGQQPRPKLRVNNTGSVITAYLKSYGAIEGCVFTRTRIFAKYMDAVNGPWASSPDITQAVKDIFRIEQKTIEMEEFVEFSLSIAGDAEGFKLPNRQVRADGCDSIFRGPDCGFTASAPGTIFYDDQRVGRTVVRDMGFWSSTTTYSTGDAIFVLVNGFRVYYIAISGNIGNVPALSPTVWSRHICLKRLTDCKANWGANAPLPFAGFPGTSYLPSL